MSITIAVYDSYEQPSAERVLDYLGAIPEFTGRVFRGVTFEMQPPTEQPYKASVFRLNDELVHSDRFYLLVYGPTNEELDKGDPMRTSAQIKHSIRMILEFWHEKLGIVPLMETINGNAAVFANTPDPKALANLFAEERRKLMTSVPPLPAPGKLALVYPGVGASDVVQKTPCYDLRGLYFAPAAIKQMLLEGNNVIQDISLDLIEELKEADVEFTLVYPALFCRVEYMGRYLKQKQTVKATIMAWARWVDSICRIASIQGCNHICLTKGEYMPELSDSRYQKAAAE